MLIKLRKNELQPKNPASTFNAQIALTTTQNFEQLSYSANCLNKLSRYFICCQSFNATTLNLIERARKDGA